MKYVLDECRYAVLLALSDLGKIYTFEVRQDFSGEEMVSAVAQLYQMGLICAEGENFRPAPSIAALMDAVRRAVHVLCIRHPDRARQLLYVSDTGEIVVVEQGEGGGDFVKIGQTDIPAFLADLIDNEVLPEDLVTDRATARELESGALEDYPDAYPEPTVSLQIERADSRTGCVERTIEVALWGVHQLLRLRSGEDEYVHLYSQEELLGLLEKELRRGMR